MKSKFFLVALIAIIMVTGMVMVSCGAKCPGDGNCSYRAGDTDVTDYCGYNVNSSWSTKQAETAVDCGRAYVDAISAQTSYDCNC